jgi:intracellular multiplication protein IcmF
MVLKINQLTLEIKSIVSSMQSEICQLFLLVGDKGAGKTSLMNQASFKLHQHISQCGSQTNIWFTENTIFIELCESVFRYEQKLFTQVLKAITASHPKLQTSGLLTLISHGKLKSLANGDASECLTQSKQVVKSINHPIYHHLIITKCDNIPGFSDFFDDLHSSERSMPLGFDIPNQLNSGSLLAFSKNKLQDLINSLNVQVIGKLHKSRNTLKKCLIREFPIQMDYGSQSLPNSLLLIQQETLQIHGLYFTSSVQGGKSDDGINKSIEHALALTMPDVTQANNNRSYFIKGCLAKIISKPILYKKKPINQKKMGAFTVGILIVSFFIGLYHVKSSQLLKQTESELANYISLNQAPNQGPSAILHLGNAAQALHSTATSRLLSVGSLNTLKQTIEKRYTSELHQQFLPSLAKKIEQQITNHNSSPAKRYQALKAYLMLGNASVLDAQFVKKWFQSYWQNTLSLKEINQQLTLLTNALLLPYQPISLNQELIINTRNFLGALPGDYLYYSLILSNENNDNQPLTTNGFILAYNEIPYFYLKQHYSEVIQHIIPTQLSLFKKEAWILNSSQEFINNESIIKRYHQDYTAWWKKFIKHSEPKSFNNYSEAITVLTKLAGPNDGGYVTLLKLIQANTRPIYESNEVSQHFNKNIASHFTSINLMSHSNISAINDNLIEVLNYFRTLNTTSDNESVAFEIARNRFLSNTTSDPINQLFKLQASPLLLPWTNKLANNAWFIIIKHTKIYINQKWQTLVYDFYLNNIAKRYPFANSNLEVNVDDFTNFFADNGRVSQFFNSYLKPFLDTHSANWKPKEVNGFIIPIKNEVITELVRANVIKRMFFKHHRDKISLDFTLQKLTTDPVISMLQLKIGDKQMTDNQSSQNLAKFHWPSQDARIDMYSIDGQHFELIEQGAWGLFKLLDSFTISNTEDDNSKLQLLININGNGATYILNTSKQVNPFIPGIMKSFELNPVIV